MHGHGGNGGDQAFSLRQRGEVVRPHIRFPRGPLRQHSKGHGRRRARLRQGQRRAQAAGGRHARPHLGQAAIGGAAKALQDGFDDRRVIDHLVADAARRDQRRHQQHGHAHAVLAKRGVVIGGGGRRHMVEEAAVLVITEDQQGARPGGTARQGLVNLRYQRLAGADIGRRVVVILEEMRIDPADRRQGARQRIADETIAARAGTEGFIPLGRAVMVVAEGQAPGFPGGIKFPADLGAVQVTHEGLVRIQGHALAVAAAGRLAADRIQAVGPGGARHGTVAAVADAELLRQEIIHGQVGRIVVTHHQVDVGVARMRLRIVVDEAAVIVL